MPVIVVKPEFEPAGPGPSPVLPNVGPTRQFSQQFAGTQFGQDVSAYPDLDPTFFLVSPTRCLIEAIAKRFQTPRGTLQFHPAYGLDIRQFLNGAFNVNQVPELQHLLEQEALDDERISDAQATVTFNAQAQSLTIQMSLAAGGGPFSLTLLVTSVTVTLIESSN